MSGSAMTCSFCGRGEAEAGPLVRGLAARICRPCASGIHAGTWTATAGAPAAAGPAADTSTYPDSARLGTIVAGVRSAAGVDDVMLRLTEPICEAFDADRLTIYVATADRTAIVSKVKMGLHLFKDIRLPITDSSIAGFCALTRESVNLADVYDDASLKGLSPNLRFVPELDRLTGYRTRQMLAIPIVDAASEQLMGVMQFINTRSDEPFPPSAERGALVVARALAAAFRGAAVPA